ncbi:hypothetical protein SCYAM73S_04207 [Streptomyces cyaneofuscatus]
MAVATTTRSRARRGHQVAEGLARAGAGLDEQVELVVDRLGDGLGHGGLAGALSVPPTAVTAACRS